MQLCARPFLTERWRPPSRRDPRSRGSDAAMHHWGSPHHRSDAARGGGPTCARARERERRRCRDLGRRGETLPWPGLAASAPCPHPASSRLKSGIQQLPAASTLQWCPCVVLVSRSPCCPRSLRRPAWFPRAICDLAQLAPCAFAAVVPFAASQLQSTPALAVPCCCRPAATSAVLLVGCLCRCWCCRLLCCSLLSCVGLRLGLSSLLCLCCLAVLAAHLFARAFPGKDQRFPAQPLWLPSSLSRSRAS